MATYTILDGGKGPQYNGTHAAPFQANIDCAALAANTHDWKLANTSNVAAPLASTGWAAADILQIFEVPSGFLLRTIGYRVTTAEGGAATATVGNASATQTHLLAASAAGYVLQIDLNSAVANMTLVAAAHLGGDTYEGVLFVTDGTIDITWDTAATAVCVLDIAALGATCW